MKRVFKFKEGQQWDGDERIFHFIEDYLTIEPVHKGNYPIIKRNWKVTITVEKI